MTTAQKVIRNLALSFACVLIVSIISGILSALYALSGVLGLKKEDKKIKDEMSMINFENSEVATLDIDVAFTNLIIKKGDFLIAESNNENINCKQNNQNLQIKEKQHNWFSRNNKGDLVVYIPENLKFEKVRINAGIGNLELNIQGNKENYTIKADKGIGSIKIDGKEMVDDVTYGDGENNIKIDGGIGSINVDFKD